MINTVGSQIHFLLSNDKNSQIQIGNVRMQ